MTLQTRQRAVLDNRKRYKRCLGPQPKQWRRLVNMLMLIVNEVYNHVKKHQVSHLLMNYQCCTWEKFVFRPFWRKGFWLFFFPIPNQPKFWCLNLTKSYGFLADIPKGKLAFAPVLSPCFSSQIQQLKLKVFGKPSFFSM